MGRIPISGGYTQTLNTHINNSLYVMALFIKTLLFFKLLNSPRFRKAARHDAADLKQIESWRFEKSKLEVWRQRARDVLYLNVCCVL